MLDWLCPVKRYKSSGEKLWPILGRNNQIGGEERKNIKKKRRDSREKEKRREYGTTPEDPHKATTTMCHFILYPRVTGGQALSPEQP